MLTTTLALAALSFASPNEGEGIAWYEGVHMSAVGEAQEQNKLLLTYFWANTENCSRLYAETMSDEGVIREMGDFICFSANAGEDQGRALLERYKLQTVPAILITGTDGESEEMLVGFMDAATFVSEIQRVKRGENTISDLRTKIAGEHEDLETELEERQMLAVKLGNIGAAEEAEALHQSILERDPKATTVLGSQAHVERILNEMGEEYGDDLSGWDFGPLEKFAKKVKSPVGKFEAQVTLAGYECEAGRRNEGIKTFRTAWKSRPKEEVRVMNSGFGIVDRIAYYGDELTSKEKAFALQVAKDLVALTEFDQAQPCEACEEGEDGEMAKADGEEGDACGCEGEGEGDGAVAYAQYQVARCQALNGDQKDAIATMELVLGQQPENETYMTYLASLQTDES
jgi:tetratricopeptide (TPR) repeat protein